jgi:hypothetical protein
MHAMPQIQHVALSQTWNVSGGASVFGYIEDKIQHKIKSIGKQGQAGIETDNAKERSKFL